MKINLRILLLGHDSAAGLALAYAILIVAAGNQSDPWNQAVLLSTGSVIFGSGLTFFLLRAFLAGERS